MLARVGRPTRPQDTTAGDGEILARVASGFTRLLAQ